MDSHGGSLKLRPTAIISSRLCRVVWRRRNARRRLRPAYCVCVRACVHPPRRTPRLALLDPRASPVATVASLTPVKSSHRSKAISLGQGERNKQGEIVVVVMIAVVVVVVATVFSLCRGGRKVAGVVATSTTVYCCCRRYCS